MTSAARADLLARVSSAALGTALLGFAGWLAWLNLRLPSRSGWIFWAPIALWVTTMGLLCWWAALGGARANHASSCPGKLAGRMVGGNGRIRNWLRGSSSGHAESELGPTARDPGHRSIGIRPGCARRMRAPQDSKVNTLCLGYRWAFTTCTY